METKKNEKVVEIEGVKLSGEGLKNIFLLQHDMLPELVSEHNLKLSFNNEEANRQIEWINEDIHRLIEIVNQDEDFENSVMGIIKTLNRYKKLLDNLKSPA